jgi:hypothetical protein
MIVEFEGDKVSHFELVEDMHGCTSTGICLGYGWNQRPSQRGLYSEDLIIIASKRKDDQIAKEFESVPEKCSVYIYADHRGHVAVNEINNVLINENTYGHFLQPPGKISVLTIRRPWDRRSGIIETQFDCGENTLLFIHLSDSTNWGWSKLKRTIRQVEYLEGTKSIKDRDLIIF